MAQKITRKATGVRRQARAQGTRQQVRKARQQTGVVAGAIMRVLPFTEEQLHKTFLIVILALAAALAWVIASMAGLTLLMAQQVDSAAVRMGFEVNRVQVPGADRINRLLLYDMVLGRKDRAMTRINLDDIRDEVRALNWVKDARVARQLPDTIVIDIVERTPHAVLAKPNRLVLIDGTGHELEPITARNAKGMLRISGPGAQAQVEALGTLLDAAPALRPQVAAAEWVGNRRWNVTFKTGQLLALPMGDKESAGALIDFARQDGQHRLIGGKATAFDMRIPPRIYIRCPECKQSEASATGEGNT